MSVSLTKKAEIFKILSDPTRLNILSVILNAKKDICVSEISEVVGVSHSATSHQLAKLELKGVVECFRNGKMMCYKLKDNETTRLIKKYIKN